MKDKKVVFMGTPEFSVPVLEMLIENTNVIMVVTQPDSYVGRHHDELKFSPVKQVAIDNNIEVFQPEKIRNDFEYILSKNTSNPSQDAVYNEWNGDEVTVIGNLHENPELLDGKLCL